MYFPLSQIQSNLYTNGNEYSKNPNSQESYVGFYFRTSKGKIYTGKNPQDFPIEELFPFGGSDVTALNFPAINESFLVTYAQPPDDPDPVILIKYLPSPENPIIVGDYSTIKPFVETTLPYYDSPLPTEKDYQIGEFRRYFCKKTNEISYIEINKKTYDKLIKKDSTILWQMYFPFNIPWKLTGTKTQVAIVNQNIVELTTKNLQLPVFSEYLGNNFTKYYK